MSMMLFCCLYKQLLTYFTPFSSVSIVDFEQVNICWKYSLLALSLLSLCCYYSKDTSSFSCNKQKNAKEC